MKAVSGTIDRLRLDLDSQSAVAWTLRVGAFMCFVGHGAFGILTKRAWLPYFAVANIGPDAAYRLMPIIGSVDIIIGTLSLICPIPAVVGWMTLWAVWTALLRPFSGEPIWESFERAGNYGVPLALLLLLEGRRHLAGLVMRAAPRELDAAVLRRIRLALTVAVVFLLVGHGVLGLGGKSAQIVNYASVLPESMAGEFTRIAGAIEIVFALIVAIRPGVGVLLFVATWKLGTESLFLSAGAPIWEFIERGGSYAAPIALAIVTTLTRSRRAPSSSRSSFAGSRRERTAAAQ